MELIDASLLNSRNVRLPEPDTSNHHNKKRESQRQKPELEVFITSYRVIEGEESGKRRPKRGMQRFLRPKTAEKRQGL